MQKHGGCNHMTCKGCGHHFCWVCGRAWSQHSESTGGCALQGWLAAGRSVAGRLLLLLLLQRCPAAHCPAKLAFLTSAGAAQHW